jgi:protein O-GlcNAc transferase
MAQLAIQDAFAWAVRKQQAGALAEAAALYQEIVAGAPDYVEAHYNLSLALKSLGRLEEATTAARAALALRPVFPEASLHLGNILGERGMTDDAIAAYRRAIADRPNYAEARFNLAVMLHQVGELKEAIGEYRGVLEVAPDMGEAHQALGNVLCDAGNVEEAIAAHRRAQDLLPESSDVYIGLGNALRDAGRAEEAIEAYRTALALGETRQAPIQSRCRTASNLLFTLHFLPNYDRRRIWREHQLWNQTYIRPTQGLIAPHVNDPTPDRRLRIGYVSPDFSRHPVGRFMLPLLANHDHQRFEIFGYSDVRRPDEITERLRLRADVWRDAKSNSDTQLEQIIRSDRIDILVDLTMHTRDNRLLVFAHKPAPVQVTYLAYCGTTGMETMDYRLTDRYLDPPGGDDSVYSEKSVRLPNCFWCFGPESGQPEVSALPASSRSQVTFGCFNNYCKINSGTFAAWLALLKKAPNSRLILFAEPGEHRTRAWNLFREAGLDPQRLWFSGFLPAQEYLRQYQHVDIALDPFPYPGGTTTFDALWMGVPVVSLAGETAVSRAGLSILSNLGLPELVASTVDRYVEIAAELATDLPRLMQLRSSLRARMKSSPLMDGPRFARDVEAAFRQMWRTWCETAPRGA